MTPPSPPGVATSRQLARPCSSRSSASAPSRTARCRQRWIARALSPEERALAPSSATACCAGRRASIARSRRCRTAASTASTRGCASCCAWRRTRSCFSTDPAYAAVNDAVDACKGLRSGPRLAGLANALLRRLSYRASRRCPTRRDPLGYLVEADGLPDWLARWPRRAGGAGDCRRARRGRRRRWRAREPAARRPRATAGAPRRRAARRRARRVGDRADGVLVRRIDSPFLTGASPRDCSRSRTWARRSSPSCAAPRPASGSWMRAPGSAARARTWRRWRETRPRSTPPTSRPRSSGRRASSAGAWACGA